MWTTAHGESVNPKVRVGELWQTPAWIGPCAALLCPASKKNRKTRTLSVQSMHCWCRPGQNRRFPYLHSGSWTDSCWRTSEGPGLQRPTFFFFKAAVVLKIFCKQFERLRAGATVLTVAAKLNRQLSRGLWYAWNSLSRACWTWFALLADHKAFPTLKGSTLNH